MPPILIRARRRLIIASGVVFAALVLITGAVLFAMTRLPVWYAPQAVNQALLSADRRDAMTLIDTISRQLNQQQPVDITIDIDQLNRWITARHELALDMIPPIEGFERPVVVATEHGLRIGLLRHWGGWQLVIGFDLTWHATPEGVIFDAERVSIGQLPIPADWVLERKTLHRWGLAGDRPHTWLWPNGKRHFAVSTAELNQQQFELRLTPR